MKQVERPIQVQYHVCEEQPFSVMQKTAMDEIATFLKKFIRKAEQEGIYFTVSPWRDHEKGKMYYHAFNAHCILNKVGVARMALGKRYQVLGQELHQILQVAVQFNLVVRIEPDTRRVYLTHNERPIVIEFRASVIRDSK